jgi:hypothetical protein
MAQMRDMEKRQQQLANCAVGRMKDVMNERDAQASLQAEISIYKSLLDNEDHKYVCMYAYVLCQGQGGPIPRLLSTCVLLCSQADRLQADSSHNSSDRQHVVVHNE